MRKTRQTKEVDRIIYEAIAANPGLGIGAISRASGCAYETVANSLPRLLDEGKIIYRERGYHLA